MFQSERFLSRISKYRKSNRADPLEEQIKIIRNSFVEMNRHLPSSLVNELADHFVAELADGPEGIAFDRCERLGDVLDVLHQQYDEENDPLDTDAWAAIAEAVSHLALDLDMEFVTYVMRLAVDHRAV